MTDPKGRAPATVGLAVWLTAVLTLALPVPGGGALLNLVPGADLTYGWPLLVAAVNVALFLPGGYLAPAAHIRLRRRRRVLATAAALAVGIEMMQWLSESRTPDVHDVLARTAGALLGYGLYAAWREPAIAPRQDDDPPLDDDELTMLLSHHDLIEQLRAKRDDPRYNIPAGTETLALGLLERNLKLVRRLRRETLLTRAILAAESLLLLGLLVGR